MNSKLFCLISSCLFQISAISFAVDTPTFKVATKKTDDRVDISGTQEKTVVEIQSPSGISQATMERTNEKWPDFVVLRLKLKGLESLKISNTHVSLHASVSSGKDLPAMRFWKDGKESELLDTKSPFWMAIKLVGSDGKVATSIPLQDGHFEMQLPKAFFEGNPKSITLNWIDFYRN